MSWNGYTVFSVISGVILVITGLVGRGVSAKNRIYALLGGVFFAGYGIYVAKQTSGTYYFPVWIFVIPVLAIGYLIASALGMTKSRPASHARGGTAAKAPNPPAAAPYPPGPAMPPTAQMPPAAQMPPMAQMPPAAQMPPMAQMPPGRQPTWAPPPPPPGSARPYPPDF